MFRKHCFHVFIFAIIMMLILSSCATEKKRTNTLQQQTTAGQNQSDITENALVKGRVGNTNYNIVNGGWIDEEGGWLYYSLSDRLYRCKEDGTEKELLFVTKGGFYDINVIGEYLYYRHAGINRLRTDGSGYEQIAAEDERGGVHFIDGKIYNGCEYRMNFDGSEKEHFYNKNSALGYTLNITDGWIYFFNTDIAKKNDYIYKMKTDGSDLQIVFDGRTDHMIVDGEWIYYIGYRNHNLYKMRTDGTDEQLLADNGTIHSLLVCDGWIYYTNGAICKVKTDGTENQVLGQYLSDDVGTELQLHGEWIYYKSQEAVYRVKTDGRDNQLFASLSDDDLTLQETAGNDSPTEERKEIALIRSYETRFGEANAVTYPKFIFEYPSNWTVSSTDVTFENETIVLSNERGVTITYMQIGNVPESGFGGGSHVAMSRVVASRVADSCFVPGHVQATDYSDLGKFAVVRLKEEARCTTTDSDFVDVDGSVSFAVLPESRLGTDSYVSAPYSSEFAFWYNSWISVIAAAPGGEFTEQEVNEVVAILSSFRCAE